MKGCASTLIVLAALCAAGYYVAHDPALATQASQDAQRAVTWVNTQVHPTSAVTVTTPAPSPTSFHPSDVAPVTPGTAPPTPTITLIVPSATATPAAQIAAPAAPMGQYASCQFGWTLDAGSCYPPGSTALWNAADCSWAVGILAWDQQLDTQEADAIASGSDTRYGNSPAVIAYYRNYAAEWGTTLAVVAGRCATPAEQPTADQFTEVVTWFGSAIAAHESDLAHVDDTAAQWDQDWIGYYQRLITMFDALP